MKHFSRGFYPILVFMSLGYINVSCVDNDYDLSKDIDLIVNIGGDLTLPSSSTESYSLAQILDLSQNSSIKPDGADYGLAEGDYVLVQSGSPTNTSVSIPTQTLHDLDCAPSTTNIQVISAGIGVPVSFNIDEFKNNISIADSQFDEAIKSLSSAETEIKFNLNVKISGNINGNVSFEPGFSIAFPLSWTIQLAESPLSSYIDIQGNKLVFKNSYSLSTNSEITLPVIVTNVDMTKMPQGQGLYAPGKFRMDDDIATAGPMKFTSGSSTAGQTVNISIDVTPSIPFAEIKQVTGIIDPEINIAASSFAITDIPEFLKEPGNNLDIDNPQIRLSVNNTSPVEANINCRLVATDENGATQEVWIGDEHGTDPILINGSGATEICISRLGTGAPQGGTNVAVANLSDLIKTIPNSISIDNITVKIPQDKEYTFILGPDSNYQMDVNYMAVVPLAFGSDLRFVYSTDEAGWDEDLSKYSFKEALATVDVENTIPLAMTPAVVALDRNGNEINDIIATVDGTVAAGTVSSPSTTSLKITLRSNAPNIGNLDGIRFTFTANCPDGFSGIPLNSAQQLRFTQIKLKLIGGAGVDLN